MTELSACPRCQRRTAVRFVLANSCNGWLCADCYMGRPKALTIFDTRLECAIGWNGCPVSGRSPNALAEHIEAQRDYHDAAARGALVVQEPG